MSRNRMITRGRTSHREMLQSRSEYTLIERFEGYSDDTPLENDSKWNVGASDDSNGTTLKGVFSNGRGWFHDFDNTLNVEKIIAFPSASPGSGISKIKFSVESLDKTDTLFAILISDGVNVILWLQIANNEVRVIEPPLTARKLLLNGSPISGFMSHNYVIELNETTEKFRILFDGNEVFAETGFDDYFFIGSGAIAGMQIQTGTPNCLIDVFIDNIAVNW